MPTLQASDLLHSLIWQRPPRYTELQLIAVIICGLAIDAKFGMAGQIVVNVWTAAVFIWLLRHGNYLDKCALVICLVIAAIGEIILSLVWGLYEYQFNNLPIFVPPGHALLMTLGVLWARRAPDWVIWAAPLALSPYVLAGWLQGWDTASAILFVIFSICIVFGRSKRLYATMLLLSLAMEIYGTWLGNWTWQPIVYGTHLTTPNPPSCAGAFYCALDLLVLGAISMLTKWQNRREKEASISARC